MPVDVLDSDLTGMLLLQETAINIGFACSLLRSDMTQYIISANLPEVLALEDGGRTEEAYALAHSKIQEQLQDALKSMAEGAAEGLDNALVIDGKALLHGLAPDTKASLLQVSCLPHQTSRCCHIRMLKTRRRVFVLRSAAIHRDRIVGDASASDMRQRVYQSTTSIYHKGPAVAAVIISTLCAVRINVYPSMIQPDMCLVW